MLPQPYSALCCGTWMSTPKVAIELWSKYDLPDKLDDQWLLNKLFEGKRFCFLDKSITCPDDGNIPYELIAEGLMNPDSCIPVTPDCHFKVFATLFPHKFSRALREKDKIKVTEVRIES